MNNTMQKFCHNCGYEINDGAAVCIKCGSLVGAVKRDALRQDGAGAAKVKKASAVISVILATVILSAWGTQLFSGFYRIMYDWSFGLLFSLSIIGAVTGLVFGILSKDKLGYCLNAAAITMTILLLLNRMSLTW